jgi:hypothetical protein
MRTSARTWTLRVLGVALLLWTIFLTWQHRSMQVVVGLLLSLLAATIGWVWVRDRLAIRGFRRRWTREGRDLLLVYSDSPHWKEYVEREWLPRWAQRAVVLNWSERSRWRATPEVTLFRRMAGGGEMNPLAIVVPPRGRVHVVRFWKAFRDFRHGKESPLRARERELAELLERSPGAGA